MFAEMRGPMMRQENKMMSKVTLLLLFLVLSGVSGRQYTQTKNSQLTPNEPSTGEEVLKELGVDLKTEGKRLKLKSCHEIYPKEILLYGVKCNILVLGLVLVLY